MKHMNIQAHFSFGNKKLPKSTVIFNCGSATNCPSRGKGLCQAESRCYAMKAERMYPHVLAYRERQRAIMDECWGAEIGSELVHLVSRKRNPVTIFRFNEAGDFKNQKDVNTMVTICKYAGHIDLKCVGYTARTDLNLTKLAEVSSLCVSNDKNDWRNKGCTRFMMVGEYTGKRLKCKGDCRICDLCLRSKGMTIEVKVH